MVAVFQQIGLQGTVKSYDKRIPKKEIFIHGKLSKSERDIITERIEEVRLKYVLNKFTFPMEIVVNETERFDCILFAQVSLRKELATQKINRLMQEVIPSPLIVIFSLEDNLLFASAIKRLNRNEQEKVVVEEYHQTEWMNADTCDDFLKTISLKNIPILDYKQVYTIIHENIYKQANIDILKKAEDSNFYQYKERTEQYKLLESEVQYLTKRLNLKSTPLKEKTELARNIEDLKKKQNKITS
ncbi:hypothetical protein M2137_001432 [Parabacteroides sp. PFB2-10]|uniref:DUF4391 domain-containing protein n=1 Tax=Parabacteroides sp. PFB2-10 TaxID=1742405 RepID=UPI002476A917|nr:DUF4391 domain-containing protein [Parabacteroides sp. PFB2-10]MDH6312657.1 hypothetical protein [Parabacteroides sp. PFB2-10]